MKKIFVVCLMIAITLSAVSCAKAEPMPAVEPEVPAEEPVQEPGDEEVEVFKILVVPPALVSPYFITLADAAEEAAANNPNIELSVIAPSAETEIDEQIKIIEDWIQKDIDLIAISTANWDALTPVLKTAREKGIEVVCIDRSVELEGVDTVSMLGVDEILGGETAGAYIAEVLGGQGNVAILEGVTGDYWSVRRTTGFNNIIANFPDISVVTTQPANWERAEGMNTMENILQAFPDLDLVWGLNDNMALGALQAVENANKQSEILVVGYNADQEAKEAVKAGRLNATIAQQPAKIAETIVNEIAVKLMEGKRSEIEPVYIIPVVLVTQDNVDDFLK